MAKEASLYSATQSHKIPFSDFKEKAKKLAIKNTSEFIQNKFEKKGKEFYQYYHQENARPWFYKKNLSRNIVFTINRARSNHYNLNFSLAHIEIVNDPSCECGNEIQDLEHIFWQCPQYDIQRHMFIKKLQQLKFQLPLKD